MQERRKTAVGRIAKFDTKEPLFVVIDKLAVPLFCDRFERRGRRSALVVFSDFYSEKRTDELIGCELFLEGEEDVPDGEPLDPDADEFYPEDLVGFGVMVDEAGEGIVTGFIDGENPLFRVRIGSREVLIPAVEEFIADIDQEQQSIEFDLPEGLLELYS